MQTTSPRIDLHVDDNHALPNEAVPTRDGPIPYPEWPAVLDSMLDVFARLHAASRLAQGASATIAPTDGSPPAPATLTDEQAFLVGLACLERPGVARMDHSFNGLLEAAMTLHLRAVLQHNRREQHRRPAAGPAGGHLKSK